MRKSLWVVPALMLAFSLFAVGVENFRNFSGNKRLEMKKSGDQVTLKSLALSNYDTEAGFRIREFPKNAIQEFSCDIDAELRNMVYLQIKRFKKRKEIGRTSVPANRKYQQRLRIDFDTLDADTIQINMRINNRRQFVGKKAVFSNFYLGKPTPKAVEENPKLEVIPGFNASSIYIGKRQAKRASEFSAKVQYRESGSSKWINALDLVYDESRNQARGSLLGLKEATKYEFTISVNDAGKKEKIEGSFTTRNSNFPIGKTIILTQKNAKKLLANIDNGTAKGYTRYTSKPGEVLEFGVGQDSAIDLSNCQYVILDGLTIRGGLRQAVLVECANDIVIRNCDISGYGRVGKRNVHIDGKFFIKKQSINYDAGVNIQASDRVMVERCFIHSPLSTSNSWFYSHPAGPTAVYTGDSSSVVLRYNDFIGSDKNRWNDAVEGWGNGSTNGSVKADAEIYGNYFAFGNDDGMEMDGGQMNCRFAYNKSEGLLCGFSTAPCLVGPAYHFRNLIHRGGDEYDFVGVGVKNNFSTGGRGALFFFNNTVLDHGNGFSSVSFNATEKKLHKEKYLKIYSRNNLVRSRGPELYSKGLFRPQYFYTSVDNDLFNGPQSTIDALQAAGHAGNSIAATIKFVNEKHGNYAPAKDSPAIGLGVYVPGVTQEKNITAGAIQQQGDELPLRFAPFKLDRSVVTLKMTSDETDQAVVTITPDKNCRGKFRIVKPAGAYFFSVTPSEGNFDGKPVKLTVKSEPQKIKEARRNTSAFAVRMCDGWSRPVSVEVDSRKHAQLHAKARSKVIMGKVTRKKNLCTMTVEVPADGYYWLFVKAPVRQSITSTINGVREENTRLIHAPRYNKNPWSSYSTTIYQGKPNRPVKLKKGVNVIEAKGGSVITAFAVTQDADALRLAPDDL